MHRGILEACAEFRVAAWIFLAKTQKCPDSSQAQVSGFWIQKAKCLLVSSSSIWHCCQVGEGWLSPLESLPGGNSELQRLTGCWGGRQRSWEGHSLGMRDFRMAGELPRELSAPWFPSALSRNAVLHTGPHLFSLPTPSSLTLSHSWPPSPSHPCLLHPLPSPCCWLHSPISQRLVTPPCPSPSLSPDQNFPSASHFPCASSLNPCLHTQALYICVFTLPNLALLTAFILLGATPSSLLPVSQGRALISPHKPSCSLLLPWPLAALFSLSFPDTSDAFCSMTPLTSPSLPCPSSPERFLPWNLLWIP